MLFQNAEQILISGAKFQNCPCQNFVVLGLENQTAAEIALIGVNFDNYFAECPFGAVASFGPQGIYLLGRSQCPALNNFGQQFVHVGYEQVKFIENETVFAVLFGFQHNPCD